MKQICVYEMRVLPTDIMFCPDCREYDGLMPLNLDTLNYLGEDPDDWREEFADYRADQL